MLLHLLRIVVIPLLWHILSYWIFLLLFILLQCFQIINYSAVISLTLFAVSVVLLYYLLFYSW